MKFPQIFLFLLGFVTTIHALALPAVFNPFTSNTNELFKRKGGGGGKSGGGGSSSGGSSGGSSSGGSSSGGSGRGSSPSSGGGSSSGGRGQAPRTYGGTNGGTFYGGGSARPYSSGGLSPSGLRGGLIGGAALGLLFAGPWLYGAYAYNYPGRYTYHNTTDNTNETLPIECLCAQYASCGCDANNNTDYINTVANNASVARVANVNGTQTLVINGTLSNDTEAATSGAAGVRAGLLEMSGLWVVVGGVVYTMWFI